MSNISQKEKFIREIERRIISGELQYGDTLPTERELVGEMKMSRTVIHTGLAELAALGFITVRPRKGYIVNDYRREGSLAVLESIMHYNGGTLAPDLLAGLMQSRKLIELETAALAAAARTETDIGNLEKILEKERDMNDDGNRAALDFIFHHTVAVASGNPVYPLILKSFEPLQKQLINTFYSVIPKPAAITAQHEQLVNAIKRKDTAGSTAIMTGILEYGEEILISTVK